MPGSQPAHHRQTQPDGEEPAKVLVVLAPALLGDLGAFEVAVFQVELAGQGLGYILLRDTPQGHEGFAHA